MVTVTLKKLDVNGNTVYTYTFDNFKMWDITLGFPVVDVPLPQEDQQERILLKLMGNTSDTKFSWTVKDVSGASPASVVSEVGGITTVDKMLDFWRSNMRPQTIEDQYEFIINFPTPVTFKGTIDNVKFNMTDGSPVSLQGSFNFLEGKVNGGIYETDPPSPPNNVVGSSPSAGNLKQDWTASTDPGSGSVDFWKFEYRLQGAATWSVTDVASTNFTWTENVGTGGTYECRMRGSNIAGDGQPSPIQTVVVS